MAKRTLVSIDGVRMWLDYLKTVDVNRKRGAAKLLQLDVESARVSKRMLTTIVG